MTLTALSSLQVSNYLQSVGVDGSVVMIKDLKQPLDRNYVVNMDPDVNGPGTHWTGLVVTSSNFLYFDSFGAPPPLHIVSLARSVGVPILWNNFIVQDINSDACGYFCVLFLLAMKSNPSSRTFNAFVNKFHDNTADNEQILRDIFL